jgi:pimeloyl-ACP methyl ester carboxylesterase
MTGDNRWQAEHTGEVRPALALLLACLLVPGCADDSSREDPTATPQAGVEPAPDPDAPIDDLHLECAGDAGPTVVLVAGLDTSGSTFRDLQADLSATARTCVYDRAGIGDSPALAAEAPDPSPGSAAADLRATLAARGIDPPYVLLGWSYGGLVAQAYAVDFPEDLAGLVLEDTSVREQFADPDLVDPSMDWREGGRPIDVHALRAELAVVDLADLPVVALSQDSKEWWAPSFYRTHDRLARASSDGVHAIGIGSGHAMHEDVPDLVAHAVEAVWAAASAGAGLPACKAVFGDERVRCRV